MESNIKEQIKIDKAEVLRYLQYRGQYIDNNLLYKIEKCIQRTKEIINPRVIYREYYIEKQKVNNDKNKVYLKNTNLVLESNNIYDLLKDCDKCILMAATLGIEIEREIRKLTYTDLTNGIVTDACATTSIEEVCDIVQDNILKNLSEKNKKITYRYSPGYGDLSIEKNLDINNLLNTQKEIGLTVNSNGIMIPRKSVVAIIGISDRDNIKMKRSCDICSNANKCEYRREGVSCGY